KLSRSQSEVRPCITVINISYDRLTRQILSRAARPPPQGGARSCRLRYRSAPSSDSERPRPVRRAWVPPRSARIGGAPVIVCYSGTMATPGELGPFADRRLRFAAALRDALAIIPGAQEARRHAP